MAVTLEQMQSFCTQVAAIGSVNFPALARGMGLNWFKDIQPLIESNPAFAELLKDTLNEMRFQLLQRLCEAALNGKLRSGPPVDAGAIKEMVKLIDSGAILGSVGEGGLGKREPNASDISEHLKRLNLGVDNDKKDN